MELYHQEQVERVIRLDTKLLNVIEDAFLALETKQVHMPSIMRVDVPEHKGEVDIKSAFIEGEDSFAVKLSSGFFNNPQLGLPSASGMMILIDAVTGIPKAVLADNGRLTDIRTAAAGAIAAKYGSRENSRVAGIIGTGSQARLQLEALTLVRPIERVQVWGRQETRTGLFKKEMEAKLGLSVHICATAEEVVRGSDVVVTTTPATEPLICSDWLHKGLHITAMGSDAEHKQELESEVLEEADLVICDKREQSLRLGELRSCTSSTVREGAIEIGAIIARNHQGRTDDSQVTVCDLTGTGVQDTAIARYVYSKLHSKEDVEYERR